MTHSHILVIFISAYFKRDPASGDIIYSPGDEYYDDSVPFEGAYPNYVNRIVEVCDGVSCYAKLACTLIGMWVPC